MPYTLQRLAPGSFDLILDGKVVGSLVRDVSEDGREGDWMAETLEDSPPFPPPFERGQHAFSTLLGAAKWLDATVPDL
ncbi:hypothetical protein [Methylobacterium pseudosasicola]|uniref:Uncharacterized protein n=1 Tax=Methylobacterium pseudosasicola TaxID=582667 RepID=A0A1I4P845_9HYPH|nr:hypothetical protein [Methylobacterium pseudosasicola]SFM23942.1 hypothetical protein SAMN05192568_1023103 [Methylobacterium pseudosasicola]